MMRITQSPLPRLCSFRQQGRRRSALINTARRSASQFLRFLPHSRRYARCTSLQTPRGWIDPLTTDPALSSRGAASFASVGTRGWRGCPASKRQVFPELPLCQAKTILPPETRFSLLGPALPEQIPRADRPPFIFHRARPSFLQQFNSARSDSLHRLKETNKRITPAGPPSVPVRRPLSFAALIRHFQNCLR